MITNIGTIDYIDQRNGNGIINTENGYRVRFNYEQVTYQDFGLGDKVAFIQVPDGSELWAQQVYRISSPILSPLEKRIKQLEQELAKLTEKLSGGFNETDTEYASWVEKEAQKKSKW